MMNRALKIGNPLLLVGASLLVAVGLCAVPNPASSATLRQAQADNTKMNKGDASRDATTADQQKMDPSDRAITQKIRAEIMKDKSLSTYAHNIKIITQDGKVTLKGPVRTRKEKETVEAKATTIAGDGNVTSEIEIAAPKS
jgi:hyperosmotically inducible periplasmic protein